MDKAAELGRHEGGEIEEGALSKLLPGIGPEGQLVGQEAGDL